MSREVYTEYARTGQRTKRYSDVRLARHNRIFTYTLAECLENKGRFIAPLEDIIANVCTEPTWVFNFHDAKLDNWEGRRTDIDLGAFMPASDMVEALNLLGGKLSAKTRDLIRDECRKRILEPYRKAVTVNDKNTNLFWTTSNANWNAVCHFGVVSVALGLCDEKAERAFFVASAEKLLTTHYLEGFGPDGACLEGLGYWGYGFSRYIFTAELIFQATGGKINLYDAGVTRLVALYPVRLQLTPGVWPAYGDCAVDIKPPDQLMSFLNRHYGFGLTQWKQADLTTANSDGGLAAALMFSTTNSATTQAAQAQKPFYEARTYFDHAGVLNCRPLPNSNIRLAASFKGGHNDEPHNHNDLGSFAVAVGQQLLVLDPGAEVYTSQTFSKDRYKSDLNNSFGHPVPVVAGQLQRAGKEARAEVVSTQFTDTADTICYNLNSAYAVPDLKTLTRAFTYRRDGAGSLEVKDAVEFEKPQTFGGALIISGKWKQLSTDEVLIYQNGEAVRVRVETGGVPWTLKAETLQAKPSRGANSTRLGLNLNEPVSSAQITLKIEPAAAPTD
jgi:hypothetical protein